MAQEFYPPEYLKSEIDALLDLKQTRIPNFDTNTLTSIDIKALSTAIDEFYAELNDNATLVLHDANNTGLKDGVTRYLNIKNTHASTTIYITLPTEKITSSDVISILPQRQVKIKFSWDSNQSKWYIDWDKSIPILLQQNTTVTIPYGSTAAEIQAIIDSYPKNTNGYTLTFQFADCPYKYFNGTTDKIVGNGTTSTVTHALHGFTNGDVISVDILRERFFSGSTTIVGDGSAAVVTRNAHGFKDGDYVKIIGTTNFDGTYQIGTVATNTFVIAHTYSGTETPPTTASVNSLNFDGDYTITVIDENTYTFASSVTGEIIPLSTGIARKVWNLGSRELVFNNFDNIVVQGNIAETSGTTIHTNQIVYLKSTNLYCLHFTSCNNVTVNNIKARSSYIPVYADINTRISVLYCFSLNNISHASNYSRAAYGACQFSFMFLLLCVAGSYSTTAKGISIGNYYCSSISTIACRTYNRTHEYGYGCNTSVIYDNSPNIQGTVSRSIKLGDII